MCVFESRGDNDSVSIVNNTFPATLFDSANRTNTSALCHSKFLPRTTTIEERAVIDNNEWCTWI